MEKQTPTVALNMQYIKDLSLEIPHAPQIFSKLNNPPKINVDLNIDAKKIEDTQFEVTLNVRINADLNEEKLFILELAYGAINTITLPEEQIETILFVEIPQLLFPYARQIISSNLAEAGLPPLLLSPVDFARMYQAKKENIQKAN
ncbi:MAG: protein-export chaperone SecB [Alphaproteobacteria bacterium]|nr:protein-export chaperone SecB [Alphaproteobacteria bacterium]